MSGRQRFLGVDLLTDSDVLVPRRETELLAQAAIDVLRATAVDRPLFLDLCCGAGNLACALALHVPAARGWATDLTAPATALARRNVEALGLAERVQVLQGDLLAAASGLGLEGRLHAIVCNPPYISSGRLERDRAELLRCEPREAFDGGPYGLSVHQRVAREAPPYLAPGGALLLEVGEGQHRQVVLLLKRAGAWEEPDVVTNTEGVPRVVMARRKAG